MRSSVLLGLVFAGSFLLTPVLAQDPEPAPAPQAGQETPPAPGGEAEPDPWEHDGGDNPWRGKGNGQDGAVAGQADVSAVSSPTLQRVTLIFENDKIAGTDRFYTNGFKLAYQRSDVGPISQLWNDLIGLIPFLDAEPLAYGFVLGQNIYTPEDTQERRLIPLDRPYGAWLYAGVTLTRGNRRREGEPPPAVLFQDRIELLGGTIGRGALGKQIQNQWHRTLSVDTSKGWSNQLRTEAAGQLYMQRKWLLKVWPFDGVVPGADFLPHVGLAVGTVFNHLSIGGTFRFGWNLGDDFGPVQRIASAGMDMLTAPRWPRFYLFARVEGRAVLYDALIEGPLFRPPTKKLSINGVVERHHIDMEHFVADLEGGAALQLWWFDLSFTVVNRTREFEQQRDSFVFGAIQLSVTF